jgi:hypothetical protein
MPVNDDDRILFPALCFKRHYFMETAHDARDAQPQEWTPVASLL